MLQAVGVPKGERDPEKLARTLSGLFDLPSRAALLFVLLRRGVAAGSLRARRRLGRAGYRCCGAALCSVWENFPKFGPIS